MRLTTTDTLLLVARALRIEAGTQSSEPIEVQDRRALDAIFPDVDVDRLDPNRFTFVCSTSWGEYKRFAVCHPNSCFLSQPHPASRIDLDRPRGYHYIEGDWKRVW